MLNVKTTRAAAFLGSCGITLAPHLQNAGINTIEALADYAPSQAARLRQAASIVVQNAPGKEVDPQRYLETTKRGVQKDLSSAMAEDTYKRRLHEAGPERSSLD